MRYHSFYLKRRKNGGKVLGFILDILCDILNANVSKYWIESKKNVEKGRKEIIKKTKKEIDIIRKW